MKKEFEEVAGASATPELKNEAEQLVKSNISTPETNFKPVVSDVRSMAAKLENFRKKSVSVQDESDFDEDEYAPHFQRVYITGEDNTGVSHIIYMICVACFLKILILMERLRPLDTPGLCFYVYSH